MYYSVWGYLVALSSTKWYWCCRAWEKKAAKNLDVVGTCVGLTLQRCQLYFTGANSKVNISLQM